MDLEEWSKEKLLIEIEACKGKLRELTAQRFKINNAIEQEIASLRQLLNERLKFYPLRLSRIDNVDYNRKGNSYTKS